MAAKIEYRQKEIRVYLSGEIDHHSASLIRASIDDAIIHKHPSLLVLDFSAVTFMDSSGIAVLLRIYRRSAEIGGRVTVRGTPAQAMKVLKAAGLPKLMKFE